MIINPREPTNNGFTERFQEKGKEDVKVRGDIGVNIKSYIEKQNKLPSIDEGVGVSFMARYHWLTELLLICVSQYKAICY